MNKENLKKVLEPIKTYIDEHDVQSDWFQNDETAKDYVKNRPGGYYGEEYPTVTYNNILYTKVSEVIPDWITQTFTSEIKKINIKCWADGKEIQILTIEASVINEKFIASENNPVLIIVSEDNSSMGDIIFEKGIYFAKVENEYLSGIARENSSEPEIQWDGNSKKIYKFDKKFLPNDNNLVKVVISDNSDSNVCTSNYTSSQIVNLYNSNINIIAEYNGKYFYLSNDASKNDSIAYFCSLEPKYDRDGGKITRVYDAFRIDNSGSAFKFLLNNPLYLETSGEVNYQFSLNVNTKGIITVKGLRNDINYDLVTSNQIPTGTSTQYVGFNSENKMAALDPADEDEALSDIAEWGILTPVAEGESILTDAAGNIITI